MPFIFRWSGTSTKLEAGPVVIEGRAGLKAGRFDGKQDVMLPLWWAVPRVGSMGKPKMGKLRARSVRAF